MTHFRGIVGINRGVQEVAPGIHERVIEEIEVSGIIRSPSVRWQNANQNDSVTLRHILSIVTPESDSIIYNEAVYVYVQDTKWSVTAIEYKRPRVELSLGSKYNG